MIKKQKKELRNKESNTLEKFEEILKPRTLDREALFCESES
jgi:hypothetical protein